MAKILLVDDDRRIHESLEALLAPLGHTLLHLYDGYRWADLVGSDNPEPPDLIISDLLMPLFNGQEMVMAIRESGNTIPIVMYFIGGSDSHATDACLKSGANEVVDKRIGGKTLQAAIDRQLAKKGAGDMGTGGTQ